MNQWPKYVCIFYLFSSKRRDLDPDFSVLLANYSTNSQPLEKVTNFVKYQKQAQIPSLSVPLRKWELVTILIPPYLSTSRAFLISEPLHFQKASISNYREKKSSSFYSSGVYLASGNFTYKSTWSQHLNTELQYCYIPLLGKIWAPAIIRTMLTF